MILITMAVFPAVFEELFFRGYLFTALQSATTTRRAIVTSSLIFGAFHVCATSTLAAERFLPSTLLGLMLGWVCWRTKSVLPGTLLHTCHNGLLLLMARYRNELRQALDYYGWDLEDRSHLPFWWLAAAGVCVVSGIMMLIWSSKRRPSSKSISSAVSGRV
jgi:ABC-2 type transport system permease protein/sodium transport system permease protein